MYVLLKKGKLSEIASRALKKAGSMKKLVLNLGIRRQRIWEYKTKNILIKDTFLNLLLNYIKEKIEKEDIEKELPNNWKQVLGGKGRIKKIRDGKIPFVDLKKYEENRIKGLRRWHKEWKQKDPEAYHLSQYEKFKKIGGYKFTTNNGENVRNALEKEVADLLKKYRITYKYEPLIKANKEYFFPDFLIKNNIIIECTAWRGYDKAFKLKLKIEELKDKYKIYIVIPKKISKYYCSIAENIVYAGADFEGLIKGLVV
jgi:hypothetical protein